MTVIASARPETAAAPPARRADIDGLRTLAILLVVVYHVWLGRVSGGVDVFLMISAYFLTASLARRAVEGRRLKLGDFWLGRFRRLLPPAAVTLLGVLVVTYLLYPPHHWPAIWADTWASLFYGQNWHLALSSVDYYARDAASTSPLQHFWSLSVQGQVFLLWPIMIGLVVLALARARRLVRPALIALFTVVFLVSLWFSVVETNESQSFADFDTRARLWEFAAGSLLALVLPLVRIPAAVRAVVGWIGVAGIVTCGLVLDVRGGFPGFLALWPVLSTAAVIVAGHGGSTRGGPAGMLGSRPLLSLSADAYALYLVHWPVLITWMVVTRSSRVGLLAGTAIILVSLVLARLLSRTVDRRFQRSPWFEKRRWRSAIVIAACLALVGGTAGGWQRVEEHRAAEIMSSAAQSGYPGAAALGSAVTPVDSSLPLMPLPTALESEWQSVGDACTERFAPTSEILARSCDQSPLAASSDKTVLIIGDSHAQQLGTPMEEYAREQGFGAVTLLKGGCTIGPGEEDRGPDNPYTCAEWLPEAVDYARTLQPTAVYVIVTRATAGEPDRLLHDAEQTIDAFLDAGIPVIAVRDNPRFGLDMYACAQADRQCAVPQEGVLAEGNPAEVLGDRVALVDFTPWFCPEGVCRGQIGNIAVYLDDNHVSRTYARSLTPMLAAMLEEFGLFI